MLKTDEGLREKFYVSRVDGRDAPGEDREDARYFVLDYKYDKFAKRALMHYAFVCQEELPELSQDLWVALREANRVEG